MSASESEFAFRDYDSDQRTLTPVTLARWAAMTAGEEWLGYVQYQLAMTAADEAYKLTNDEAARVAAGQLYTNMVELPTSDMPASEPYGEQAWNAARSLFAMASNISEEQADTQLRADFGYYMRLIQKYFDALYTSCVQDSTLHYKWLSELMRFTSITCGVIPDDLMVVLDARHDRGCPHCRQQ